MRPGLISERDVARPTPPKFLAGHGTHAARAPRRQRAAARRAVLTPFQPPNPIYLSLFI